MTEGKKKGPKGGEKGTTKAQGHTRTGSISAGGALLRASALLAAGAAAAAEGSVNKALIHGNLRKPGQSAGQSFGLSGNEGDEFTVPPTHPALAQDSNVRYFKNPENTPVVYEPPVSSKALARTSKALANYNNAKSLTPTEKRELQADLSECQMMLALILDLSGSVDQIDLRILSLASDLFSKISLILGSVTYFSNIATTSGVSSSAANLQAWIQAIIPPGGGTYAANALQDVYNQIESGEFPVSTSVPLVIALVSDFNWDDPTDAIQMIQSIIALVASKGGTVQFSFIAVAGGSGIDTYNDDYTLNQLQAICPKENLFEFENPDALGKAIEDVPQIQGTQCTRMVVPSSRPTGSPFVITNTPVVTPRPTNTEVPSSTPSEAAPSSAPSDAPTATGAEPPVAPGVIAAIVASTFCAIFWPFCIPLPYVRYTNVPVEPEPATLTAAPEAAPRDIEEGTEGTVGTQATRTVDNVQHRALNPIAYGPDGRYLRGQHVDESAYDIHLQHEVPALMRPMRVPGHRPAPGAAIPGDLDINNTPAQPPLPPTPPRRATTPPPEPPAAPQTRRVWRVGEVHATGAAVLLNLILRGAGFERRFHPEVALGIQREQGDRRFERPEPEVYNAFVSLREKMPDLRQRFNDCCNRDVAQAPENELPANPVFHREDQTGRNFGPNRGGRGGAGAVI